MNIQVQVALDKERKPEQYCPRHDPAGQEDPTYVERELDRETVGGELW